MALLCLANTPLPAPWVQWLEREPERPARLQTPYVAASGEFAPPAAAVAAAVSATGKAVGDGIHSSAAVGGGSVPEGGAAALQQAGAAAAAAPGAARNVSGNAGSTGLGAAAAAENATAKLENVRLPKVTPSRPASQRERESTFSVRVHLYPFIPVHVPLTPRRYSGRPSLLRPGAPPEAMRRRH